MSFQGDVAGIGLGELLQSLARGGKDGVLKLYGADLAAHVGVLNGLLHLLESQEEDADELARRCDAAWVLDPDPNLIAHRRSTIARASRMETLFSMLEAPNLHFRFEPGPLPLPRAHRSRRAQIAEGAVQQGEAGPWGKGLGVEALLLEHARIADESTLSSRPPGHAVARRVEGVVEPPEFAAFMRHCDGGSTVLEIADRLGWPLRQAQGAIVDLMSAGLLRLADPSELLHLAHLELDAGRDHRARDRFLGWMDASAPGLLLATDAAILGSAWESGRLGDVLRLMPARSARGLVRKLDLLGGGLLTQLDRWEDLAGFHGDDPIVRFKRASLRVAATLEGHEVEGGKGELVMECLRIARTQSEKGLTIRTRAVLLLAAAAQPESPQVRTELGARLIEAGLQEEGAAWMIAAAQALIEQQDPEKAVQVLGALLKGAPDHREAHILLTRTRTQLTRSRKRRKHGLVALAGGVALSLVAFVEIHARHDREQRFDAVTAAIGEPLRAIQLLDEHFPDDRSDRIEALRASLEQRLREADRVARLEWQRAFDDVGTLCESASVEGAFEAVVALPQPPRLHRSPGVRWPSPDTLLERLLIHVEADALEFAGLPLEPGQTELDREAAFLAGLRSVSEKSLDLGRQPYSDFAPRLDEVHARSTQARAERERLLAEDRAARRQSQQDQLLAAARLDRKSGRFAAALENYRELLVDDSDGELAELFAAEVDETQRWLSAHERAVELAESGEHDVAFAALEEAGLEPADFKLLWRVESEPAGAAVRVDGADRGPTPFVLETAFGERLELQFELEGCEPRRFEVDRPGDLRVALHRRAEHSWPSHYRVEAAPVPVGADHLVADRQGRLERIAPDGTARWSVTLETLAGVARTPQMLPARPGHALVLAEDGRAWICDASDGSLEGPIDLGAPVLVGPYPIHTGIAATFENGTYAIWTDSVDPLVRPSSSREALDIQRSSPLDEGLESLVVLRPGNDGADELSNPWNAWRVEPLEDHYRVRLGKTDALGFTVAREGEWAFVAWEMPSSLLPAGRLWVSDDRGLRAFNPGASSDAEATPEAPTVPTGTDER